MHGYRAYNCALLKWWENEFFRLLDKLEFAYCLVLKTIWSDRFKLCVNLQNRVE